MHMPSGTRKSNINHFVIETMENLEIDENKQFRVIETTFEKLGLLMGENNGKMIWYSDEARHFFPN